MAQSGSNNGHHPWRPVTASSRDAAIGVIVNPLSGRDIRRVVAQASVFPNAEKANMVLRMVAAAGALGLGRVLVSTDDFGVAASVLRGSQQHSAQTDHWPELTFCELDPLTGTAEDTKQLVRRMRADGAGVIVVLGGDGTVRAAASEVGGTPLLPLSTGTNNAFPQMWEATVAGVAAALVARGDVDVRSATQQAKVLEVQCGTATELALVDVCVSATAQVGARALWKPETLRELYCAFAEPHAIGLSSIAGQLLPTTRDQPHGVAVHFATGSAPQYRVLAPITPGKLTALDVSAVQHLPLGEPVASHVPAGTVALDGERECEFGPGDEVTVRLTNRGPRVLDVQAVLDTAARRGLLRSGSPTVPEGATGVDSWRVPPSDGGSHR
ncbi:NAD(+)/NADH kinase [Saccharopolyspora sp. NPDC002686]|uniref:ATP-NAD kinase family protein n=1 Tax=Saccharopolyspora sp. NPDC002686 TaxID=3154541 RepID=UPI00332A05EB